MSDARNLPRPQCAGAVLMIKPAAFDYNPETAGTNSLQRRPGEAGSRATNARAKEEFQRVVQALKSEGVEVCDLDDTPLPPKPDAIFPNNWVTFHADGTVVLYPMFAENRRRERRTELIDTVAVTTGFKVSRVLDLTHHEEQGRCLEGTGSLVLDHTNRVAYACVSPRTHPAVIEEWCQALGYEPVVFRAVDRGGSPIYHTNVLMCIGERVVVVGTGAIVPPDRSRVLEWLKGTGREVIEIGHHEIERFAGNMLELASWDEALGDYHVLAMSAAARESLSPETFARLSACTDTIQSVPIPTKEKLSGGSVRCMLAEVFLPS
jgi:hypothetical protein